jgi:hypothetical protein
MSGCFSTTETNAIGHGRGVSRRLRISSSQVSMVQHRTFAPPLLYFTTAPPLLTPCLPSPVPRSISG